MEEAELGTQEERRPASLPQSLNRLSAPSQPRLSQAAAVTSLACARPPLASPTARAGVRATAGREGTVLPSLGWGEWGNPCGASAAEFGWCVRAAGDGFVLGVPPDRAVRTWV